MRLVYYVFDLLHLDGRDTAALPLVGRKGLLGPLIADVPVFSSTTMKRAKASLLQACLRIYFEGVVSKTIDAAYASGSRGLWRKSKCLNRQEFVVVGWTEPEGSRPDLGYYNDDGELIYAGRVGAGMTDKVLADLRRRLEPLARASMPLSAPPPARPASDRLLFSPACNGSSRSS